MKKSYVYQHVNIETNEFYIGSRYGNNRFSLDSNIDLLSYVCSSKLVKRYIIENRNKWISKIIKEFDNPTDAYQFEQDLIKSHWGNPLMLNKQYQNGTDKKFMTTDALSDSHKQKISKALSTHIRSQSHRDSLSNANKGKIIPNETRKKISNSNKGKKRTLETRNNISTSLKGHIVSEITRNKISASKLGKPAKRKGKDHPSSKAIICVTTGEIFESQPDAAKYYNIRQGDINNVLKGRQKTVNGLIFKYQDH